MTSANSWTRPETSNQTILESMAWTNFLRLMPNVLFCAMLAVVGTIGNILSIYVFMSHMRRNFMNDLFILLSGTSLLACAVCLPGEIFDMYYAYVYPSAVTCKVGRYFNLLSTTCIVTTLFTLALYRLRAAQASTSQSLLLKTRLLIFTGILLWSCGFSLYGVQVYGIKTLFINVTIHGENSTRLLLGRDCAVADDVVKTLWPMTYNLSMLAGFLLLTITTIVCYYRIWRLVVRSRLAVSAHVTSSSTANKKMALASTTVADDVDTSSAYKDPDNDSQGAGSATGTNNGTKTNMKDSKEKREFCTEIYPTCDTETQAHYSKENGDSEENIYPKKRTSFTVDSSNYKKTGLCSTSISFDGISTIQQQNLCGHLGNIENSKINDTSVKNQDQHVSTENAGELKEVQKDIVLKYPEQDVVKSPRKASMTNIDILTKATPKEYQKTKETLLIASKSSHKSNPLNTYIVTVKANIKTPVEIFRAVSSKPSPAKAPFKASSKSYIDAKKNAGAKNSRKTPKSTLESNITKTALLLAVTFILCYVPFFCVSIPSLLNPDLDYGISAWSLNFVHLAYRLYFVTPAINPFIFYASNLDFRRKIKELVMRKRGG